MLKLLDDETQIRRVLFSNNVIGSPLPDIEGQ